MGTCYAESSVTAWQLRTPHAPAAIQACLPSGVVARLHVGVWLPPRCGGGRWTQGVTDTVMHVAVFNLL
eukprot:353810-Chlamydomonas_euryale.AAC.2